MNLTGYTVTSAARPSTSETTVPITVSVADQIATPGRFTLSADTATWAVGRWVLDVLFLAPGGDRYYSDTITLDVQDRVTSP